MTKCSFAVGWLAGAALVASVFAGCDSDGDPGGAGATGGSGGGGGTPPISGGGGSGGGSDGGGGAGGGGPSQELSSCLFVNACQADGGTAMGMQSCLAHFYERQWHWASYGAYRLQMEAMECRLSATDCDAVRACDAVPSDFDLACAESPGETLCVDDTWVICDFDGAATDALDCSAAGKSCNVDIWAGCGTEPCSFGATPNSCDQEDPNVLVMCAPSGFVERVDCSRENNFVLVNSPDGEIRATIAGEVCGDDPMLGGKGCVGQGAPCDFFSQECSGDTLITCAGGQLSHRDCGEQEPAGQSCGFVTDGPFAGGAACGVVESECDPGGDESCADGVVSFCAQGRAQVVACSEHGFSSCDEVFSSGRTVAYCTP